MRNNQWLADKLSILWLTYFEDIAKPNNVLAKFGRKSKTRLGSISKDDQDNTVINISGYMKSERVPEYIIEGVLAHELCHYTHGFHSPHKRLSQHPHYGGVVTKELAIRGLGDLLKMQKKWLKLHWSDIIK